MNSIAWLSMDAMWLFGYSKLGLWFGVPSIATGLLLLYVERRRPLNYVFLSTNCWIWMNVAWMVSDTYPQYEKISLTVAKTFLFLGLAFVIKGAFKPGGLTKALAHYKGYKHFKITKSEKIEVVK